MKELDCLRCGEKMRFLRREKIQLGQTGYILREWPNLLAGALEAEIYCCPQCGKLEFYRPGSPETEAGEPEMDMEDLPPEAQSHIVSVSMDGIPQVRCPVCGRNHDFDYPKCPYCDHEYP